MSDLKKIMSIIKNEQPWGLVDHFLKKLGLKMELDKERKRYEIYKNLSDSELKNELCKWYFENTGRELNIDNPKTFNEKLQWLKLYDSTEQKTLLADKYRVREWFAEQIGEEYLVPLLGVWNSFDEIDFNKLPSKFALKANHGSGYNIIVKDKNKLNMKKAKKKFDFWLNKDFSLVGGFEMYYRDIKPVIIAEEYLENTKGLIDYRFYCFNGEPMQIWVDIYSGTPNHRREIYDMNWNKLPIKCKWPSADGLLDEKPVKFDEMKKIAKKLSESFYFVRVDFYEVNNKLYMGEMTFIPMSGIGSIEPYDYDIEMGRMLKLPID